MDNYTIVVQGTGAHHNTERSGDADKLAEDFVQDLKAKGHQVHHATITHGGHEHLHGADEDNSGDEKAAG